MPRRTSSNYLDIQSWRLFSRNEMLNFLKERRPKTTSPKKKRPRDSILVVRTYLRPVDIYSYLKARFGEPNGIQNMLRSDDSDNIYHWDYHIKAGKHDVYIVGATRSVHLHVSRKMKDADWIDFINTIKSDYARVAKAKSQIQKSFEKWVVFQNKFSILADNCADLHANLIDAPPFKSYKVYGSRKNILSQSMKEADKISKRATRLYGDCLKLRLLTPIMAEAFLNLFILVFCRPEVRNDKLLYASFVRAKIPERIEMLRGNCQLVVSSVDKNSETYKNFLRMINKRNDLIHGNMDPERDKIETVYFEGKRPLLFDTGDHMGKFFEQVEKLYDPQAVVKEYENTHSFLFDLVHCLHPSAQRFFLNIMDDSYPGYEVRQQRVTRLFPSYIATANYPGLKFDDELNCDPTEVPVTSGGNL